MDVAAWLRGLGLGQYERVFRDNAVDDADVLRELTETDLEKLGVLLGHRKRILKAVAALGDAPVDEPQAGATAERRQLTVLFCDLAGSTALAARLDPEELRAALDAYRHTVAGAVAGQSGYVAKYMGDGVLAYFGWPRAREDDAERAVRAGLAATAAVGAVPAAAAGPLAARVGVATGPVVVGDLVGEGEARERAVAGGAPNLAARLQALAGPGEVIMDAATRRLTGALFACEDLGEVPVKGLAAPVRAWRVLGEGASESRFEALRGGKAGGVPPLLGRDEELGALLRRWAEAKRGEGQAVLLEGEPGVGKSRLVAALQEALAGEDREDLVWFCSPHHTGSALHPVVARLERAAGFQAGDAPEERLAKLEALLAPGAPSGEEVALISDLLGVPGGDRYPLPDLGPPRRRERLLAALLRRVEALARRRPVLAVLEDAHWADPSTRELLDLLVARVAGLPVLLVVTHRPEFEAPWAGRAHTAELRLGRLRDAESAALVAHVAGGTPVPPELVGRIVGNSDGIPLFVEELTRAVLEGGPPPSGAAGQVVPSTLQASLMARLDGLGGAKEVAQIGSVIGRAFDRDVVGAVAGLPGQVLEARLERLVASGLVHRRGEPPAATYAFKHALVQEAAYESLLRGARSALHARIAEVLAARDPELERTRPELLGHHCARAGLTERAVLHYARAGHRSAAQSALAEARAHFAGALDLLSRLPRDEGRDRRELELQAALGAVLVALDGYAGPETGRAYARAREVWERLGRPPTFLSVPWGQWLFHLNRAELADAERVADELLRLGSLERDACGQILGHLGLGGTMMVRGAPVPAHARVQEALDLYEEAKPEGLARQAGLCPKTLALAWRGLVAYWGGHPRRGLADTDAAVAHAERVRHPPSLVAAVSLRVRLLIMAGDEVGARRLLERLRALTAEHAFPFWATQGVVYEGWLRARRGDPAGADIARGGREAYAATGARLWGGLLAALVADALEARGEDRRAAEVLMEAVHAAEETGEHWFTAELMRRTAVLDLRRGEPERAEALLRDALQVARRQGSAQWALRSSTGLARMLRGRGRASEARDVLAPICACFTEGFELPDLAEAKALLDELDAAAPG